MFQTKHDDDSKSLFNAGIAKLMRIDKLKLRIHEARIKKDYSTWLDCLSGWREEMSERMSLDQEKECNKFETNIEMASDSKSIDVLKKSLNKYGIFLSKIEYKIGFSMPDMEDAAFALK